MGGFVPQFPIVESVKPVILCGDLNVAHKEIDIKNPAANRRNAGFTDEEGKDDRAFRRSFIDASDICTRQKGRVYLVDYFAQARERNMAGVLTILWSRGFGRRYKGMYNHDKIMGATIVP